MHWTIQIAPWLIVAGLAYAVLFMEPPKKGD